MVENKNYIIDATNKPLGRLASQIAHILMGKHKASFVPYKNMGDEVIVKNIKDVKISGKKLTQKKFYRHTGYVGNLKSEKLEIMFKKNPGNVLKRAVIHMLPKNRLMKVRMKNLKIE
ncbi:MAG: 50S ribosomal protein L13 [Ignavibacterium sp.]|nr:50S ribosomal protein L13 [Ignavibacterium sp.]